MESYAGSYPYQSLSDRGLRYLVVLPGLFDEELNCSLIQDITGDDTTPYQALSYVWGSNTDTVPVKVDGATFPATVNLEDALRHLRLPTEPRRMWVDAICINQADLDERQAQVRRMKSIYENAEKVAVWLGREDDMDGVPKGLLVFDRPMEAAAKLAYDIANIPSQMDLEELLNQKENWESFHVLTRLFLRKWFTRVWVLQELAVTSNADIICGKTVIPWEIIEKTFVQMLEFFAEESWDQWGIMEFTFDEYWKPVMARCRTLRAQVTGEWPFYQRRGTYEAMIYILDNFVSKLNATDERDRIFGIQGIIQGIDSSLDEALLPDYRKPPADVFADVTKLLINRTNSLLPLHSSSGPREGSSSWFTNWQGQGLPIYMADKRSANPPGPKPMIKFISDKILRLRGVQLGAVHTVVDRVYKTKIKLEAGSSMTALTGMIMFFEEAIIATGLVKNKTVKEFHDMCREVSCFGLSFGSRQVNYEKYDVFRNYGLNQKGRKRLEGKDDSLPVDETYNERVLDVFCKTLIRILNEGTVFVTDTGLIGRSYEGASVCKGDLICLVQGGFSPIILTLKEPVDVHTEFFGNCVLFGHNSHDAQAEVLEKGPYRDFDIV